MKRTSSSFIFRAGTLLMSALWFLGWIILAVALPLRIFLHFQPHVSEEVLSTIDMLLRGSALAGLIALCLNIVIRMATRGTKGVPDRKGERGEKNHVIFSLLNDLLPATVAKTTQVVLVTTLITGAGATTTAVATHTSVPASHVVPTGVALATPTSPLGSIVPGNTPIVAAPTATPRPVSGPSAPAQPGTSHPTTAPTATNTPPPAPASAPPIQAQILIAAFTAIAPDTNSPIEDVTCLAGAVATGGGFNSGYTTFVAMQDAPISPTTWRGEIYNTGTSPIWAQLQVVCMTAPHLQAQVLVTPFSNIAPGTNSSIDDVSCPAGYIVTGGGFNSGYTTFVPMQDAPISTTTWRGEIYNTGTSPVWTQLQVVCVAAAGLLSSVQVAAFNNIAAGTNSRITDVMCPAGYIVTGGGFNSGYTTFVALWNAPIAAATWRGEVYNTGNSPIWEQIQVVCLASS